MKIITIINSMTNETFAKEKHFQKCLPFWFNFAKLKLFILDVDDAMKGKSF